MNNVVSRLLH